MVGFGPADAPPSAVVKFVGAGTAACIADLLTFPLDTAKVRLQVRAPCANTLPGRYGKEKISTHLIPGRSRERARLREKRLL